MAKNYVGPILLGNPSNAIHLFEALFLHGSLKTVIELNQSSNHTLICDVCPDIFLRAILHLRKADSIEIAKVDSSSDEKQKSN